MQKFLFVRVIHFPGSFLRHLVRLPKGDAPLQEQPQPGAHGVSAGFHDDEVTLW